MRSSWIQVAVGSAALLGCVEKMPQQKPTPPDMNAIVASYAHPNLALDAQNVSLVAGALTPVMAMVERARTMEPWIRSTLQNSADQAVEQKSVEPSAPGLRTEALVGEGFIDVVRICPGTDLTAGPDEASNGSLKLTLGFTEDGIDPVVWGAATRCKVGIQSVATTVDGALKVFVGDNGVAFDALTRARMLFQVTLTFTTDQKVDDVSVDFRLDPSGGAEYRVFLGDQHVVYWDDLKQRGYRAANGKFTCDFDKKLCIEESGTTLSW
jgi:hypothetical protein